MIDALLDAPGQQKHVFAEHAADLDPYLDLNRVDDRESERLRGVLSDALRAASNADAGSLSDVGPTAR